MKQAFVSGVSQKKTLNITIRFGMNQILHRKTHNIAHSATHVSGQTYMGKNGCFLVTHFPKFVAEPHSKHGQTLIAGRNYLAL